MDNYDFLLMILERSRKREGAHDLRKATEKDFHHCFEQWKILMKEGSILKVIISKYV